MAQGTGFRIRRSKWLIAAVVVVGLVIVFGLFLGGVTIFNWTESTAFCSSCHIMKPEVTAYHGSPHSRIECGTCHVGPGVLAAVQAKLEAVRYLYRYPLNLYERPLPSPITSLRPVEVVCEQCHWPQKFYNDRLTVISNYAADQTNSLTQAAISLHVGGQQGTASRGIHWHIANPVYYIATDDARQNIPWVQADFGGKTTTYVATDATLTPEQIAKADKRKMDCVDCHNRATHIFQRPSDAIDSAMAAGTIAADLPSIKQQGVAVLEKKYASDDEAGQAIAGVENFYKTTLPDVYGKRQADVKAAVAGLQAIYNSDQFPFMNVDWQSHPNNIGHQDFPGCFRCHDGKHVSSDGQAVRLECNICHTIPQVAGPGKTLPPVPVAVGSEPASHRSTTWLAEHRTKFDASCAACHNIENAGGSDNSSFCSNSACHGTAWKYASLNAPQVRQTAPAAAPSGQPPAIPHPTAPRIDCKVCHAPGKVRPFPQNHASFTLDTCTGCHKPAVPEAQLAPAASATAAPTAAPTKAPTGAPAAGTPATAQPTAQATVAAPTAAAAPAGGPPAIPHALDAVHSQCLLCHATDSSIKPAPKDHSGRTIDTCQACHKPATPGSAATAQPTVAPAAGTAATAQPTARATAGAAVAGGPPAIPHDLDVMHKSCLLCHAIDSSIKPAPKDHAGRTEDTCQACHKPAS